MQFKISAALAATLALANLAAATPARRNSPSDQCNTGSLQCCDSTQAANTLTGTIAALLTAVGIDVSSLTGEAGVTCSPITVVGVSGTSCSQQTVCCTNNSFNGVVALGCTPINLNL